jgi:hypothetical protein
VFFIYFFIAKMETENNDLTAKQLEDIETLKMITALGDTSQAVQYLEMCGWNLEQAVNLVLEGGTNVPNLDNEPQPMVPNLFNNIPEMQPMLDDPAQAIRNLGPIPPYTADQKVFSRAVQRKADQGPGWVSWALSPLTSPLKWLYSSLFETTTGGDFIAHATKHLNSKLLVNFENENLQEFLDCTENSTEQAH